MVHRRCCENVTLSLKPLLRRFSTTHQSWLVVAIWHWVVFRDRYRQPSLMQLSCLAERMETFQDQIQCRIRQIHGLLSGVPVFVSPVDHQTPSSHYLYSQSNGVKSRVQKNYTSPKTMVNSKSTLITRGRECVENQGTGQRYIIPRLQR